MSKNFHEQFGHEELPLPSDRSTGLVFAAVAAIVAWFWRADQTVMMVALGIAAGFVAVSLTVPSILRPLNIAWMKFALLLNKIMSPIIMLILFLITMVPFGLVMQLRYDPLRKQRKADDKSYWIERKRDGPTSSMTNQF